MLLHRSLAYVLAIIFLHILKRVQSAETVLKTALGDHPFNTFQEVNKPCQEGCLLHGNCNHELGVCECPFGLSGPTCQTQLYPACRTLFTSGAQRIYLGRTAPRNCYCYLQLVKGLCLPDDESRCAFHTMQLWDSLYCFKRKDTPEEQQLSDLPEKIDDPAYEWGRCTTSRTLTTMQKHVGPIDQLPTIEDISKSVPLSRCKARCYEQGVCQDWGGQTRCLCFGGYKGDDCSVSEVAAESLCPDNCGARGKCIAGFCKCDAPYWGLGCSRSKAYEPVPGSVAYPYFPSLKIYVYDVPPNVVGTHQFEDGDINVFFNYQSFMRFEEMLLHDINGVRTENPYEANLFYIPAFAYYSTSNLGDPTGAVIRAVNWVASTFPFFNRTGGKDHFILISADRGACYLKRVPQTEHLIRVTHFGYERQNITDMGQLLHNTEYGCFKAGRDVVMSPYFKAKVAKIQDLRTRLEQPGGLEAFIAKKDVLFFFSGDIRHNEPEYSGGVRQALSLLLSNNSYPDVVFKGGYMMLGGHEYEDLLARSKFCMAPYGHGFGIRLTHALMHACVPVIIQDKVRQPFEDILHYPDFSIRVSKAELPRLVEMLRAVPQEDLVRMTKENSRIYRAFIWQPELGGLAYNFTLASLWRRVSHLRGELYEAGVRR
ncbi:hypothetical protein Vafri_16503 [Volvox africanus]|uniref:EGF-like domain-containing protein n=1 Tax=Volvox africanus TaxID=51714 RepID=A0A8J4BID8_9CHLO|nr:hypothetical protein Vafri_16503 [Volvox africanus]